jgi:hypothetical protein
VALCLNAVPDDPDAAVLAGWRERVDCTLEAVEGARPLAGHAHLKSLVILVSTNVALGHIRLLPFSEAGYFCICGMSTLARIGTNARLTAAFSCELFGLRPLCLVFTSLGHNYDGKQAREKGERHL